MKAILVDDEQKFITMLAKRLGFRGVQADAVFTGQAALERVQAEKYDVAVLDIKMPGISGHALKAELEALDPTLKFVFVTGHGGRVGGAPDAQDIYLSKPLDIDDLIDVIGKIVS